MTLLGLCLNSVNREIARGEEIPEEVLFYLERLVEDITIAIDDYERYGVVASVLRGEWIIFECLMSFFSSPTGNNSTDFTIMKGFSLEQQANII